MVISTKDLQHIKLIRYPDRKNLSNTEILHKYQVSLTNFDFRTIEQYLLPIFCQFGLCIVSKESGFELQDFLNLEPFFGHTIQQGKKTEVAGSLNYFKVEVIPNSKTAGLTPKDQAMHVDGVYDGDDMPSIIMLHCQKQSKIGGHSIVCDGKEAFTYLQKVYPEGLNALQENEALEFDFPFRGGIKMRHGVFNRLPNGKFEFFYTPYTKTLKGSPEAEKAYRIVSGFVHSPRNQIKFKLTEGQALILDNKRFVHGKLGFPAQAGRLLNRIWYEGNPDFIGFEM